jgi:hypothetical protein
MLEGHFGSVLGNDNCRPTGNLIPSYTVHVRAGKSLCMKQFVQAGNVWGYNRRK